MICEEIELNVLLDSLKRNYGYDFTEYARTSLKRRIEHFVKLYAVSTCQELMSFLLKNEQVFEHFVRELTVNVTAMFRDPPFYASLRQNVIKRLSTYPFIKIWIAGCSTGEEVYSIAILLKEEGLLHKSIIYATDINPEVIVLAKKGIYPLYRIKNYTENYISSGGRASLMDYYKAKYNAVLMDKSLRENVVFSVHNLTCDRSFNEFELILCRNVLIYFNRDLQNRTVSLLHESLCKLGILCLGNKESLHFTDAENEFHAVDRKHRIYKKIYR